MYLNPHNANWFLTCVKHNRGGSSWWLGKGKGVSGNNTNLTVNITPCLIWSPWKTSFPGSPETIPLPTIWFSLIRNTESPIPNYKTWKLENWVLMHMDTLNKHFICFMNMKQVNHIDHKKMEGKVGHLWQVTDIHLFIVAMLFYWLMI